MRRAGRAEHAVEVLRQMLQDVERNLLPGHPSLQPAERNLFSCPKPCNLGCQEGLMALSKDPVDTTAAVSTSPLACNSPVFACIHQSWASFYNGSISQQCWKRFLGMTLLHSHPQAAGASHSTVIEVRMPPPALLAWHHTSDRHLPCCVPRGSECLPKPRHSIIQPSHSESKPRHQEASQCGWEGLTAVRAEPPLPPPALCFTGRSYYQEMFPSAPLIPLFTAQ